MIFVLRQISSFDFTRDLFDDLYILSNSLTLPGSFLLRLPLWREIPIF
jgi:hypothetical protein